LVTTRQPTTSAAAKDSPAKAVLGALGHDVVRNITLPDVRNALLFFSNWSYLMISLQPLKGRRGVVGATALAIASLAASAVQAAIIPAPANSTTLNPGQSVKLDQLTLNNISGVVVGDKLFSNFVYSWTNNMPAPANVNVVALNSGGTYGIRFQGSFVDLPGGADSDASISFTVSVLDTDFKIDGANLASAIFLDPNTPGSFGSIDESFLGNTPTTTDLLHVFNSTLGAGGSQFEDSVVFATPYSTLHVQKDIYASAAELAIQPVRMTIIDQLFPQTTIPEPTSIALLLGSVAVIGVQRRNRQ
jgi:hypothetical protein